MLMTLRRSNMALPVSMGMGVGVCGVMEGLAHNNFRGMVSQAHGTATCGGDVDYNGR